MIRPGETESQVKGSNTCRVCHQQMALGTPTYRNRGGNHRHRTCEPKTPPRPSLIEDATGSEGEMSRKLRVLSGAEQNRRFNRGRVFDKAGGQG